jgi:hypothetical protein
MDHALLRPLSLALVLLASVLSGCATVTQTFTQEILVETREARADGGQALKGVACKLNNDKGEWTIQTPGEVTVTKSAADLFVRCQLEGHQPGTAVAVSRVHGAMFGNILIGGVVGAVVDHSAGTAYNYPETLSIEMGTHKTFDRQDGEVVASSPKSDPSGGNSPSPPPGRASVSVDDLKDLLPPK